MMDKFKFKEDTSYTLEKVSSKNPSPYGIPDSGVIMTGEPFIKDISGECVIFLQGRTWNDNFRTSPILKVKPLPNGGYKFETHNSIYTLKPV
jgi:hypothetical protein